MAKDRAVAAAPTRGAPEVKVLAQSAIVALANRLGIEATDVFLSSLRNVAFRTPDVTNEQLMALVVVANQYELNPFTRELFAFPERPERGGGIIPIVSVDGWFRIINEHPQNNGITYREILDADGNLIAGEATVHRKDRGHPTVIVEKLAECKRNTDPWKAMPSRMLRHKTLIQAGRVAFGFVGIYEPDEAERIVQAQRQPASAGDVSGAGRVLAILDAPAAPALDMTAGAAAPRIERGPDTTAGAAAVTPSPAQDELPV